jgi:ABC-type transporter Mla subunit MlaD
MRVAKITTYIFFLAVFFLVVPMPEPTHAQETPNPQAGTVDDGKLRSFAKVYVQVEKIRQTYGRQLKETQDPQKNIEIQKEAKSKIDDALAQAGMTVESYSQVVQTMNDNDELRKKAIEFIDQERTKP